MQHFKFAKVGLVDLWFRFFDVTNMYIIWADHNHWLRYLFIKLDSSYLSELSLVTLNPIIWKLNMLVGVKWNVEGRQIGGLDVTLLGYLMSKFLSYLVIQILYNYLLTVDQTTIQFGQRSKYIISIKFSLHKQTSNPWVCYKTRLAPTRNFTVSNVDSCPFHLIGWWLKTND